MNYFNETELQDLTFRVCVASVNPVSPPAAYIGGKRILAKAIIERINATPHTGYAEPFVGMGGVFLRRSHKPKTEVINDTNGEVANLFRILQRHYPQFMETLKFQINSRREFQRLAASDPSTLTDLERAARFLYLQRLSFGGKVTVQNFGVDRDSAGRFNITRLGPVLEDIHERMAAWSSSSSTGVTSSNAGIGRGCCSISTTWRQCAPKFVV